MLQLYFPELQMYMTCRAVPVAPSGERLFARRRLCVLSKFFDQPLLLFNDIQRLTRTRRIEHFHRTQTDTLGVWLPHEVPLRLHLLSLVLFRRKIGDGIQIGEAEDERA